MRNNFLKILALLLVTLVSCSSESNPEVTVKEVRLDKTNLELLVGEKTTIKASVQPARAVQPTMQWVSSNDKVATVAAGNVTAIAEGKAVITATCEGKSASCSVTVKTRSQAKGITKKITFRGKEDCPFADYAEYGIYIPEVDKINAVLVLQHGCGMEQFGITRNYDLQYQAFAKKWKLMVIETALHGNCYVWGDALSGSAQALFKIIEMQAKDEDHPELTSAPLLLFGHSGGGFWTLSMLNNYPEKILAAVCYSAAWDPTWTYKPIVSDIPILLRYADNDCDTCEATAVHTFARLRAMNGFASIACNLGENHNLSRLRHMAIPFYEAALRRYLDGGPAASWLGNPGTKAVFPESGYIGDKTSLCRFLDEETARKWQEYVKTNDVADVTPPPAPYGLEIDHMSEASARVRWMADADVESGIQRFVVLVNGSRAGFVPSSGIYQNFDLNGDNTYPTDPQAMEFILTGLKPGSVIAVKTVNQYDLESETAEITF